MSIRSLDRLLELRSIAVIGAWCSMATRRHAARGYAAGPAHGPHRRARFGGNRDEALTIMTNGGGAGVMATDAAAFAGTPLAELSAAHATRSMRCCRTPGRAPTD